MSALVGPLASAGLAAVTAVAEAAKRDPDVARRLAEHRVAIRRGRELDRAIRRWSRARVEYLRCVSRKFDLHESDTPEYERFAIAEGKLQAAVLMLADHLTPDLVERASAFTDALDEMLGG